MYGVCFVAGWLGGDSDLDCCYAHHPVSRRREVRHPPAYQAMACRDAEHTLNTVRRPMPAVSPGVREEPSLSFAVYLVQELEGDLARGAEGSAPRDLRAGRGIDPLIHRYRKRGKASGA